MASVVVDNAPHSNIDTTEQRFDAESGELIDETETVEMDDDTIE